MAQGVDQHVIQEVMNFSRVRPTYEKPSIHVTTHNLHIVVRIIAQLTSTATQDLAVALHYLNVQVGLEGFRGSVLGVSCPCLGHFY